jgi:hypothetical protein
LSLIRLSDFEPSDILIEDEDIYVGYRRPIVVLDKEYYNLDEDLPEHIQWNLFLARQVAMMRYREVRG